MEMKKSAILAISVILILIGFYLYRYLTIHTPKAHTVSGSIYVNKTYTTPIKITPDSELYRYRGLYVVLEGKVKDVGISRKGTTFFLHLPPLSIVIFPDVASSLNMNPLRLKGKTVKVKGVLRYHPKYGWEIILRNAGNLEVVP